MKLFDTFTTAAPNRVFVSIVFGVFSGICYSLLIPLVLNSIAPADNQFKPMQLAPHTFLGFEVSNVKFATLFLVVCVLILFTRSFSQIMLTRLSMNVTSALRVKMYEQIANAPISALERLGSSKLIAVLTTDVPRIINGASIIPLLLMSIVTVTGMLGFLLFLNSDIFWFVLSVIVFGIVTFQIPNIIGARFLQKGREHFDHLQESIRGLIYGAKELKINSKKRESFFKEALVAKENQVLAANKSGFTVIQSAASYGDLISFFVIGAVAYIFVNYHSITNQELVGTIMALLYITSPIALILSMIPQIFMAKVSLNKVNRILQEIPEEDLVVTTESASTWQAIEFKNVSYHYESDTNSQGFQVGPVNFTIRKGEITFIVGGNGSGKSTLSKLITMHYSANEGEILFDGDKLTVENLHAYRQGVSAIYSDYYLFEQLHGVDAEQKHTQIQTYLQELQLDSKVEFKEGKFSTLALSDGQKRRLALLVAYVEDKDLYLFDEWAADQDPTFKAVFYQHILPGLKARNKAVVVISHDDRYFDVADHLIVMEEGKMQRSEQVTEVDKQPKLQRVADS